MPFQLYHMNNQLSPDYIPRAKGWNSLEKYDSIQWIILTNQENFMSLSWIEKGYHIKYTESDLLMAEITIYTRNTVTYLYINLDSLLLICQKHIESEYIYHLMCPYFFLQLGNITLAVPNDVLYLSSCARQFQHYQYSAYICKIVSCSSVLPQIVMPISWLLYSMFGIHERTFIFSTPFIA